LVAASADPCARPLVRVLVVDDHLAIRELVGGMVAGLEGFELVGAAGTGARALELGAEVRPDMVLLDVQLPDLSGIDVAKALSASAPRAVIVLMSADDALLRSEGALACEAAAVVPKRTLRAAIIRDLWAHHGLR
jgi:DNA-binding NarL/FixJ family response regulator